MSHWPFGDYIKGLGSLSGRFIRLNSSRISLLSICINLNSLHYIVPDTVHLKPNVKGEKCQCSMSLLGYTNVNGGSSMVIKLPSRLDLENEECVLVF